MERLRQLISYIQDQLSGLTVSQRLSIGLCVALIVGSFIWLLQWSTTPDLVPLLTHDFSYGELDAVEASLKTNGLTYKIRGTRVFVRMADRHNALRVLHTNGSLPEGILFDMQSVVTDQNPFQAPEARAYAQNYAKGNELAKIIATSPSVQSASVLVNPKTKRRLGGRYDVPTASVTVTLASGIEMNPEIVEGFAKLVSGAVAGLKPHNVYITDARTLRAFSVPEPGDVASFDYLRMVKQREAHLRSKILNKLADIPGALVEVTVELETSKRVTQRTRHDAPQTKLETSHSTEAGSGSTAAEPGVQANLGQAVTASGGGGRSTTEETVLENYEPRVSEIETIEHMPFATKSVTATIGIPRSFIASVFQARFPDRDPPADDDADFKAIRDEQVSRVRSSAERIIMAKSPDDVDVDIYPDMQWTAEGGGWSRSPGAIAVATAGEGAMDTMSMLRDYGPQVGLGGMAMLSLFMMLRVAKSAAPPVKPQSSQNEEELPAPDHEPILTVGSQTVGQAESSHSFLTGREVDPETLRYSELGDEVSSMVKQNPESAAQLLRRWVEES